MSPNGSRPRARHRQRGWTSRSSESPKCGSTRWNHRPRLRRARRRRFRRRQRRDARRSSSPNRGRACRVRRESTCSNCPYKSRSRASRRRRAGQLQRRTRRCEVEKIGINTERAVECSGRVARRNLQVGCFRFERHFAGVRNTKVRVFAALTAIRRSRSGVCSEPSGSAQCPQWRLYSRIVREPSPSGNSYESVTRPSSPSSAVCSAASAHSSAAAGPL